MASKVRIASPASRRARPPQGRRGAARAHVPLSAAMLARVARRFEALSDPSRLQVLQAVCGGVGTVSEIAAATGQGPPGVSRHLARLGAESFVVREPDGRRVHYRVADDTPLALCAAICAHLSAADAKLAKR